MMFGNSFSLIPLPFMMNFIPFHSNGLCDEVITNPAPYFLDSRKTTGVGTVSKLYIFIPFFINVADAISLIIVPDGLVSLPITHFLDSTKDEKLLQNCNVSFRLKSSPNTPLIPEIVFFI